MAWYPIAEAKAKVWQPDAFLTLAEGENIQAPFSGEVVLWEYDFFSPSLGKLYFVEVSQGQVAGAFEGELIGLSPEQYVGLKTITEWKIGDRLKIGIKK